MDIFFLNWNLLNCKNFAENAFILYFENVGLHETWLVVNLLQALNGLFLPKATFKVSKGFEERILDEAYFSFPHLDDNLVCVSVV